MADTTYQVYAFHVEATMSPEYMDEIMRDVANRLADSLDNGEPWSLTVNSGFNSWNYEGGE